MMKTNKKSLVALSLLALGLASSQSHAAQGSSEWVENVDINFPGVAAVINIENASANKFLSALDLDVKTSSMQFEIGGLVDCKGNNMEALAMQAHFGPVSLTGGGVQIDDSMVLYRDSTSVSWTDNSGIIESGGVNNVFSVPLNQVKNGHPALRVDPLDELNKKLQAHINGGGKAIDFYKQDQVIVLQRPISLSAACRKESNAFKVSSGYETKNHTIQINYKGDPALKEPPVLNAQLQGNMANQIDAGDQPFKLNSADFMANIPHQYGQCISNQNPVIRVNYSITGDEVGEMDFRIVAKSNQYADYGTYYEELGIAKNPQNTGMNQHFDFEFPLKELLSQDKYSYMAISNNKTYNHNMLLQARFKPALGQMSQWKDMDTAIFKHRCVPQLSGQLQGGNNGGIQGYDNGNSNPVINGTIKALPQTTAPKPAGVRAPVPTPTPKPMTLKAPAQAPTPNPLTVKPIEPEPVNELQLKTR